jgi:triacylglycerol lipase
MTRVFISCLIALATATMAHAEEGVILLHGLCRTDRSMGKLASALAKEGYVVLNVDYPSRTASIEDLAATVLAGALQDQKLMGVDKIHFIAHSMGAILVRQYCSVSPIDRLGKVVMLGPPNQGSEVVDRFGDTALFEKINGPGGRQLGTRPHSIPNRLGPVNFELGIIAGDRSINWINSAFIAGPDDGKVSVERTKVAGMKEHLVIHASHPFLMRDDQAIRSALRFLRTGTFARAADEALTR